MITHEFNNTFIITITELGYGHTSPQTANGEKRKAKSQRRKEAGVAILPATSKILINFPYLGCWNRLIARKKLKNFVARRERPATSRIANRKRDEYGRAPLVACV